MQFKLIRHDSIEYEQMTELRMELLRRPLGLSFTKEQLATEKNDILVGAFGNDVIIGCSVLTPHNAVTIQLRQMAVKETEQAKGVGRSILEFSEKISKEKGYTLLMLHTRNTALGFYKKSGYEIKGHEFLEVTIPHHYMEKKLW